MRLESTTETEGLVKKVEVVKVEDMNSLSIEFVDAKGLNMRVNIAPRDYSSILDSYKAALEGEMVRYTENTSIATGLGLNSIRILEILTGRLAGKAYIF